MHNAVCVVEEHNSNLKRNLKKMDSGADPEHQDPPLPYFGGTHATIFIEAATGGGGGDVTRMLQVVVLNHVNSYPDPHHSQILYPLLKFSASQK